jgi:protein-tyrosine-phosphatase
MTTDWTPGEELLVAARRHAALGDPHRLSVVEELLVTDRSPAWFAAQWGMTSNLVAHHVGVLVDAGLLRRTPSQGDRRRVYLQLTAAGRSMLAQQPVQAGRVVFVCTHNSARSQFAEALWRQRSRVPVSSAGTRPARSVHPLARRTAARHGIDLSGAVPKTLQPGALDHALVVTVCDSADRTTDAPHLHWSVPDPVAQGTEDAFEVAWQEVADRVEVLAPTITTQD